MQPRYRWLLPKTIAASDLAALGLPDHLTAQVLFNRGLRSREDVERFLTPESFAIESPFSLPGVHEAVALLRWALARRKRVVVYGDYDVDGLSATATMVEGLTVMDGQAYPYIPNRLETGYGLDPGNIRRIAPEADVLVTVDCGIRSLEEVALAKKLGLSVIVTDHHLPMQELPAADAVVSARLRPGHEFADLAGVGIAEQVIVALSAVHSRFGSQVLDHSHYLDLVALGTIADVAPLTGVNRHLVRSGLEAIRQQPRVGIQALLRRASLGQRRLCAWHIAFALAPRLNATGRLGSSLPSLELLMTRDARRATVLAEQLEHANATRRAHLERCLALAHLELQKQPPEFPCVFTASDAYPPGIVGLIASRLAEEQNLPAVAVSLEGNIAHGSVRSSAEFNASDALDTCRDLLSKHGGHSLAAGFTCPSSHLEELRERLGLLAAQRLNLEDSRPILQIDAETELPAASSPIWDWLPTIEPTGCGNPYPIFLSRGVQVLDKQLMGRDGDHLSLLLVSPSGNMRAVGFRMGDSFAAIAGKLDVVYRLDENEYNGNKERRLVLLDWQPESSA
ncbi:MAG: single-stranded-DNA-specific exonuclease RecJ [Anaerolineae bacterium]